MNKFVEAPQNDVVVSCRVRLARNYSDVPFSPMMTEAHAVKVIDRAVNSMKASAQAAAYDYYEISRLTDTEKHVLIEKHLISHDLINRKTPSAALISTGETVSIMLNEEDHLRIQGFLPGLQLLKAQELAFSADDILTKNEPIAFDSKWGYLTTCPTNAGTGLRASTLMHLPAITATKKMGSIMQAVSKVGFIVRGLYGEGSEAEGCLYQLSNQASMGRSEEDIIKSMISVCEQVAQTERDARKSLEEKDPDAFYDKMMRSVGILLNARLMDEKEFMQRFSDLRLAASMGVVNASIAGIDHMMQVMQNASLSSLSAQPLNERERMLMRASETRIMLSELIDDEGRA